MAVYRAKIAGRKKPVLLRAGNRTEAIGRLVETLDALTGDAVEEALDAGEKVWKPGEPLPADDVETDAGETDVEA